MSVDTPKRLEILAQQYERQAEALLKRAELCRRQAKEWRAQEEAERRGLSENTSTGTVGKQMSLAPAVRKAKNLAISKAKSDHALDKLIREKYRCSRNAWCKRREITPSSMTRYLTDRPVPPRIFQLVADDLGWTDWPCGVAVD